MTGGSHTPLPARGSSTATCNSLSLTTVVDDHTTRCAPSRQTRRVRCFSELMRWPWGARRRRCDTRG
jgi:hypothetical protein